MMHHFLQKIGFPLLQKVLGNGFWDKYQFLSKTKYWKRARIEKYQLKQLKKIVSHAYANVPFYRKRMDIHGITPKDIKTLKDIQRLPIVTKKDFRAAKNKELFALGSSPIPNRTAGSTGTPFEFFMDKQLLGWKQARYFHTMNNAGLTLGKRYARVWGLSTSSFAQDFFMQHIFGRKELDAFDINNGNCEKYLKKLQKIKPPVLESYASSINFLATYAQENNIQLSIPTVITSAENLYDYQKKMVQKVFNAHVINRYGSREFGNIAQECKHNTMHIIETNFYVEEVKGRLIVTCFDNHTMPFIRYDMGDLGQVRLKKCACGRHTKFISGLAGRTSDMYTTPKGRKVPPTYFYYAIDYHYGKHIDAFQIVIKKDKLIVRIVPRKSFTQKHASSIIHELSKSLDNAFVEVKTVKKIPQSAAGKRMAIIRK